MTNYQPFYKNSILLALTTNYPKMKYSRIYFLRDTDTILD
jgi:hypothetical protein